MDENESTEYDEASIASFESNDSSCENDDVDWVATISSDDDPDDAIMKLIDVANAAYVKRDAFMMFSGAFLQERIKGVKQLDVLNKQHEFALAHLKYIEFYVDFEQVFIHKTLLKDDVTKEAEQLFNAFRPNDIIGFQTYLNDYLLNKIANHEKRGMQFASR